MQRQKIHHLAIRGPDGRVVGIVATAPTCCGCTSIRPPPSRGGYLDAPTVLEQVVADARQGLPRLVHTLLEGGGRPADIARMAARVGDASADRLIELAVADLGPPPAEFAFLALGSQGRSEQTLVSDQDNAILYADPPAEQAAEAEAVRSWRWASSSRRGWNGPAMPCAGARRRPATRGGAGRHRHGGGTSPTGSAGQRRRTCWSSTPSSTSAAWRGRGSWPTFSSPRVDRADAARPAAVLHPPGPERAALQAAAGLLRPDPDRIGRRRRAGASNLKDAMMPIFVNFARLYALKHGRGRDEHAGPAGAARAAGRAEAVIPRRTDAGPGRCCCNCG